MKILIILVLLTSMALAQNYALPADRTIPWLAGTDIWNGGVIPNYASVTCTGLAGNGTTNDGPAIQTCITALSANQCAFIPAGTYLVNSTVRLKSNSCLRGAGPTQTILNEGASGWLTTQNFSRSVHLNPSTSFATFPSTFALSGTPQKGDTTVTITSGAPNIGDFIKIFGNDDPSVISDTTTIGGGSVCDWCGDNTGYYVKQQVVQVTNKVGSVLTLSRPLYSTPDTTARTIRTHAEPTGAKYNIITYPTQKAGFESFRINATGDIGANQIITFQGCAFCWAKGVETQLTGSSSESAHIAFFDSYGGEVRDSYVHDGRSGASGSNYGIYFEWTNSDHKIENNIMRHNRHSTVFQGGGSGVAILYNYIDDDYTDDLTYMGSARTSHGAQPFMNLYEGNIASHIAADDCWGTSEHFVFFRNSIWGDETMDWTKPAGAAATPTGANPNNGFAAIDLYTAQIFYSFVGNTLGRGGLHTTWSAATLRTFNSFPSRTAPVVYSMGGAAGTTGSCANVTNSTAPSSDTTSLNHGNYDQKTQGVAFWEGGSNHSLDNSIYYVSKPAFLGSKPWPLIGPDVVSGNLSGTTGTANTNPAEDCWVGGTFDPVACYAVTTPAVSLTPSILTFTSQVVGTTSSSQPATLTNTGTATLNISSITISGDFSQTNTCSSTLGAGLSCTINVSFVPTFTSTRAGTLSVADNASGSPHTVSLSGTGVLNPQLKGQSIFAGQGVIK